MIIPLIINQKIEYNNLYIKEVRKKVDDIILNYCRESQYAFISRLKSLESLTEKIESGRYEKWSDLDDIFGCAIIIPNLDHESQVIDFLSESFESVILRKRGSTLKDPTVFRFDCTRFIGKLKDPIGDLSNELKNTLFEVQIRSAFEHAWTVATHDLTYKGEKIDWRSLRLAAQLKAAVEKLDILILGFHEIYKHISEQDWPELITKKKFESFFCEQFNKKLIPLESQPTNWTRFCENVYNLMKASFKINKYKIPVVAEKAIEVLTGEIEDLGYNKFPRSISLFQFVMGALIEKDIIKLPLKEKYYPFITTQLIDLYPKISEISNKFLTGE